MKRIIIIGIAVTLMSTLATLACRKPADVVDTPSLPTANPTVAPTEDHFKYGIPHERLILRSVEEYLLFASSVELDDAECEEFLSKNFFASGIKTKADAIKALEDINALPFIPVDGFEMKSFEFDYSKKLFSVGFLDKADEDRVFGFQVAMTGSDAEAERKEAEQAGGLIELPDTRSPELIYLSGGALNYPEFPNVSMFFTNIRSHKIRITTNNLSVKEAVDILANCEFTTMDEYAKKANP